MNMEDKISHQKVENENNLSKDSISQKVESRLRSLSSSDNDVVRRRNRSDRFEWLAVEARIRTVINEYTSPLTE
jgi:hypothetical protein